MFPMLKGKNRNKDKSRRKGISVFGLLIPSLAVLAVLHASVVGLIFGINHESGALSSLMQQSAGYVADATSLLAGSSLLSETSTNFILRPETEDGEMNIGPLMAYSNELQVKRRGDDILEKFKGSHVSEEALQKLQVAASSADYMIDNQLHSLALIRDVYPFPTNPVLSSIPIPELSVEEEAWGDEQKVDYAAELVLDEKYASNKQAVSVNVNACVSLIQSESGAKAASASAKVQLYRVLLWIGTFLIITVLIITFGMLAKGLIRPIANATKKIEADEPLDEGKGFQEMRLLSSSYNGLLRRRDDLDGLLRTAAEKDVLTGLNNRYAYDERVHSLDGTIDPSKSVAIAMFDVNYLKRTNDTLGHKAGDDLLRQAASLIESVFGGEEGTCYRIGGDEFAAILIGKTREEIKGLMERFLKIQEDSGISVSYGYSFAPTIKGTDVDDMLESADFSMYQQKAKVHKED